MSIDNMPEDEVWKTLSQQSFLRNIDDPCAQRLRKMGRPVHFPAGTIVFTQGEPATLCYLIAQGRVILEICGSAVGCAQVQTLGNGDFLGWSAVLGDTTLTATARTQVATDAIEFQGAEIRDLCDSDFEFGYQFIRATAKTIAKRLTSTRLQLIDTFSK